MIAFYDNSEIGMLSDRVENVLQGRVTCLQCEQPAINRYFDGCGPNLTGPGEQQPDNAYGYSCTLDPGLLTRRF